MVKLIIVQLLIIISFFSSGFCHAYFKMSENNLKLPCILCLCLKSEMVHYSEHSLKDQSGTKHESSLPRTIYCMSASHSH